MSPAGSRISPARAGPGDPASSIPADRVRRNCVHRVIRTPVPHGGGTKEGHHGAGRTRPLPAAGSRGGAGPVEGLLGGQDPPGLFASATALANGPLFSRPTGAWG